MLQTVSYDISGTTYKVTQLGALTARNMSLKLGKTFAKFAEKGDIVAAIDSISEEDFDQVCDTLARSTRVVLGAQEPLLSDIFDLHFAGNLFDMFVWLRFALEANFKSFFERARQALGPDGNLSKTVKATQTIAG